MHVFTEGNGCRCAAQFVVMTGSVAFHAAPGYTLASSTASTWGLAVTGNIIVIGTDPGSHGLSTTESNAKTGAIAVNDGGMSYVAGVHSLSGRGLTSACQWIVWHTARTAQCRECSSHTLYLCCAASKNNGTGLYLCLSR